VSLGRRRSAAAGASRGRFCTLRPTRTPCGSCSLSSQCTVNSVSVNTANVRVADGWYSLVSTGHHVRSVPDPAAVIAASDIGVKVSAARPG
jgi:hypothetical protein